MLEKTILEKTIPEKMTPEKTILEKLILQKRYYRENDNTENDFYTFLCHYQIPCRNATAYCATPAGHCGQSGLFRNRGLRRSSNYLRAMLLTFKFPYSANWRLRPAHLVRKIGGKGGAANVRLLTWKSTAMDNRRRFLGQGRGRWHYI